MEVAQSKIAAAGPRKRQNGGSEGGLGERLGEIPKDSNEMAGADAGWSDAREQTETFLLDTGFHSHL